MYGKPLDSKAAPAVALPALFARTGEYVEKRVIVEGRIGQVRVRNQAPYLAAQGLDVLG